MIVDRVPHNGHAQAGAVSLEKFFRIERLEDLIHILRQNSDAAVADLQDGIVAFSD